MFLQILLGGEHQLTKLTFNGVGVKLHVRLEMIFRCDFLIAYRASVNWYFDPVETTVSDQQLTIDKALLAVLVRALERLVPCMSRHVNIQADLIGQLLVAKAANPLLGRLEMATHVLVIRILRHVQVAEPAPKHLRIVNELKLALMSLGLLQARERPTAELAMTNVKDAEVDFRSFPFLVEASVLCDSSVSCVLFTACLTDVAVRV